MAKVAVILVNFNGSEDTIECLKSLQTVKNCDIEVVVVDNKSTDDSVACLQPLQEELKFVLLVSKENKGFSAGNNIGIEYARNHGAEYFLLLNNDTVVDPDFVTELLRPFEKNSNCGVTTSKILLFKEPDVIWYAGGSLNHRTARTEHLGYGEKNCHSNEKPHSVTFASGCCLCISKKVIEKIGLLDERFFLYEEDVEFCYRVVKSGFDIIYNPKSILFHKVSASTGSGSPMSQYYTVRNKYLLIWNDFHGFDKVCALVYCTLQMLFRSMKGELQFRFYAAGLKSFIKKETGKSWKGLK